MSDLEELHKKNFVNFNERKNWNIVTGHQISLFKENKLKGDLVFRKSILCSHSPKELNQLFNQYHNNNFKFIFIAEKWSPDINAFNVFRLDKPENINKDSPYINSYFHHNYFYALNKNGYEVLSSNIHAVKNNNNIESKSMQYYLLIFAKSKSN